MKNYNESGEFSQTITNESKETRQGQGHNVTIHNFWQRHSQKRSGEVFNANKTGLSISSISMGGVERATALGKTIQAGKDGAKGYKSDSLRTQETFDAVMVGYQEKNPGTPVREKVRLREQLIAPGNKQFVKIYDGLWNANKTALLAELGLKPENFGTLSPDEQERIAEAAEEPVIRDWLDNPESNLAKAFPPQEAAADFAVLFNHRHERMAKRLNDDSEVDLFHNTHKTATEAFLASGVLIRKLDGKKISKIADLGGSLQILDNWESTTKTDKNGNPTTTVTVRGQEFSIDPSTLEDLVAEGKKHLEKKEKE